MMQRVPPSNEALAEINAVIEKVLAPPGERLIGLAMFILLEPDGDPTRAHGQLGTWPSSMSGALLAQTVREIERLNTKPT